MKIKSLKRVLGIVFLVVLFLLLSKQGSHNETRIVLPVNFFLPESFYSGQKKAESSAVHLNSRHIYAVLVPHHLVAGEIISQVFEELKDQHVKKIIVIAPNHYEAGSEYLQENSTDWSTPFGIVRGRRLIEGLLPASPETMTKEHGVAGLMPYVSYYLPKAQVTSVIVKYRTPDQQLTKLAETIASLLDQDTVLLASVDFSHYLPLPVASRNDEYTKQLLLELSEKPLYTLSNDYLDSPGTLSVLMKSCKNKGVKNFDITGHSNSAIILNNPYLTSTTSHFAGLCEE